MPRVNPPSFAERPSTFVRAHASRVLFHELLFSNLLDNRITEEQRALQLINKRYDKGTPQQDLVNSFISIFSTFFLFLFFLLIKI